MRTLWAATELGLEYEHWPLAWDDPRLKEPDFLELNPAGTIPTIIDDGFALSESMAINLYLAKKYGHGSEGLYPSSARSEAEAWRWSLWAQGHIEPWVQRDADAVAVRQASPTASSKVLQKCLHVLERALLATGWLVEGRFTVADLNVAGVLSPSRSAGIDMHDHPNVAGWLGRCYSRPAAREVRQRFA